MLRRCYVRSKRPYGFVGVTTTTCSTKRKTVPKFGTTIANILRNLTQESVLRMFCVLLLSQSGFVTIDLPPFPAYMCGGISKGAQWFPLIQHSGFRL